MDVSSKTFSVSTYYVDTLNVLLLAFISFFLLYFFYLIELFYCTGKHFGPTTVVLNLCSINKV